MSVGTVAETTVGRQLVTVSGTVPSWTEQPGSKLRPVIFKDTVVVLTEVFGMTL
jgi:hypothetical protein